jgi:hypothetical protein
MKNGYLGWAKLHGSWRVVCRGDTVAECMRLLLDWVRQQPRPPKASAVRPAGTHPDARGDSPDTPARR